MIGFLNTLLLVGAFQGIIFSVIAFASKKFRSRSNFFLGLLILVFSLNLIQNYLVASELVNRDFYFGYFFLPFSSLYLVLFYFYVKTFLSFDKKSNAWNYLLFLPFAIAFLVTLAEKFVLNSKGVPFSEILFLEKFREYHEIFSVGYSLILAAMSYLLIVRFEKEQSAAGKNQIKIKTNWLKIITILLFVMCLYWIIPLYLELTVRLNISITVFYALWIGLSVTIYLLGHIALYQYGINSERKKIHQFAAETKISKNSKPPTDGEKSGLILEMIRYVETDKNYLDSNLSLEKVSAELGVNNSYLSRLIHSEMKINFSDYVNRLRVEEAKAYMNRDEFMNYNLISIGLEAGFNSKTTFYKAFKKYTGITPSEFKNEKSRPD